MADHQRVVQEPNDEQTSWEHNPPINVKVVNSTGAEEWFKMRVHTKMSKLMDAYAKRVVKDRQTIRFFYDGESVSEEDTPASLGMEDGDTIDVRFV